MSLVQLPILVVDDDPICAEFIREVLVRSGQQCIKVVSNGEAALDAIERSHAPYGNPIRLCFMDILMPVMDGKETVELLRRCESHGSAFPRVAVVGLSAHDDARNTCVQSGMDKFVEKSPTISKLQDLWKFLCVA